MTCETCKRRASCHRYGSAICRNYKEDKAAESVNINDFAAKVGGKIEIREFFISRGSVADEFRSSVKIVAPCVVYPIFGGRREIVANVDGHTHGIGFDDSWKPISQEASVRSNGMM